MQLVNLHVKVAPRPPRRGVFSGRPTPRLFAAFKSQGLLITKIHIYIYIYIYIHIHTHIHIYCFILTDPGKLFDIPCASWSRQAYKRTIDPLSWERCKTGSATETTDNIEKQKNGRSAFGDRTYSLTFWNQQTRGIEPSIRQTMLNVLCGLWVLGCGHGASKLGQPSDKIKPTSGKHLSNNENKSTSEKRYGVQKTDKTSSG